MVDGGDRGSFSSRDDSGLDSRYNSATKFTDEGANIFHTPLSQLRSIVSMLGYVFAFYLAQSFVLKKNQGRWIQLLGLLLACALQLASANRTVAAGYVFCFVLAFFILKRKIENDRPVIDVRAVFAAGLCQRYSSWFRFSQSLRFCREEPLLQMVWATYRHISAPNYLIWIPSFSLILNMAAVAFLDT